MRAIAAIPAAGLLAGAAAGLVLPDLPRSALYILLIAAPLVAAWACWTLRPRLLTMCVVVVFFAGGALLSIDAWRSAWRPSLRVAFEELAKTQRAEAAAAGPRLPEEDEAFAVIEGVLRADAALGESGVTLSLDVDRCVSCSARLSAARPAERSAGRAVSGGVIVNVAGSLAPGQMDAWRAGRRVRLPAQLRRTSRYLDPGVPDHERALARRGTTLVGSVKSATLVAVLAPGTAIDEAMASARAVSRRAIADAVGRWSTQSAAIVAAIVIGDRAGLDAGVQRRLQEAGTYHVIAISGGNIAILAGLLIGAFRVAGWLGRTAMLSSIALLLAYADFVGGGASVDRATLMAVVYFGARAFDQRSDPLNALALVAALLVAADPLTIADPAFLLTFGATLAILLVVPGVTTYNAEHAEIAERTRISAHSVFSALIVVTRKYLWPMFVASLATEALLFPVGALVFSRVTFAGLALNFLAIPLMGVAQVAGMAVVPIALVSTQAAAAAGWIAHVGAAGLVWSADLVRFAPAATYRLAPPSWWAVAVYYGALAALFTVRSGLLAAGVSRDRAALVARGISRAFSIAPVLVAAAAAIWILVDPRTLVSHGDGRLHVTFIDVGQGDSVFVVFPRGSTLLVDAGGLSASSSFDVGDRVVAPVIREAGFRRIDRLALSHGDPDHVGGAMAVLREFRPREVWEGIPVPRSAPLTAMRVAAQSAGARWANVYAHDGITIDDVRVVAHHPEVPDWERQKVRNDDSLVLELRWRDVSVLLTGDIGRSVERRLEAEIPASPVRVVKIPHHGSLTSSSTAFLDAIHPTVAIVSAGRSNHFGHPVPEVLERYRSAGAEIFRTDQDGAVEMSTDGSTIEVSTFTGRAWEWPR